MFRLLVSSTAPGGSDSLRPRGPLRPAGGLLVTFLLALPGLSGCQSTRTQRPTVPLGLIRVSAPRHMYEVLHGEEERVGLVVLFEGANPDEAHYMVRNVWQQDLGLVDHLGRAYRYFPHRPEPLWVGTGTVEEGVREILGMADCLLFELPFEEVLPTDHLAGVPPRPSLGTPLMGAEEPETQIADS